MVDCNAQLAIAVNQHEYLYLARMLAAEGLRYKNPKAQAFQKLELDIIIHFV